MGMYGYKESDHLLTQTMVGYKQLLTKPEKDGSQVEVNEKGKEDKK